MIYSFVVLQNANPYAQWQFLAVLKGLVTVVLYNSSLPDSKD